jgi:hypothetical protein
MAMPMQVPPGGESPSGGQIEAQLITLLKQAMQLAQKNGIDFKQLLMKVMGEGQGQAPAPPMPR